MSEQAIQTVTGKSATIQFDGGRCIHARRCVLSQPTVFKANVEGSWIDPDAASAEALLQAALNCPSGAIHVRRYDGGADEANPKVNTITVRENGPLAVNAEIVLAGAPIGTRATLCRCGASKNKPYCDGSHVAAAFTATGEPPASSSAPLAKRDGALTITPYQNGPLGVAGAVEVISGTGRTIDRVEKTALCRCGHSGRKPFCDGTHARVGFTAP
ncbi:MAG TPA: CDGSH iron-sulfur domain-containing protein [Roseiarcus sp.]